VDEEMGRGMYISILGRRIIEMEKKMTAIIFGEKGEKKIDTFDIFNKMNRMDRMDSLDKLIVTGIVIIVLYSLYVTIQILQWKRIRERES
jgi:hypothetical protein